MTKIFFSIFHTIGDVIVSTALIHAIKLKYPDSEITYAVSKDCATLLEGNPDISKIIPCNSISECILLANQEKYDKVFIPAQLTGEHNIWHQTEPWIHVSDKHNLVDYYALRCNDDITVDDRQTYFYLKDSDFDSLFSKIHPDDLEKFKAQKYITIHTTSRCSGKDWHYQHLNNFVKLFKSTYPDIAVYQIGGPNDKPLDAPVVPFMGLSLRESAVLIKGSLLQVDMDSGTSFIADSLGVPVIVIYGATNSNTSGPIGKNLIAIEPVSRDCIGRMCHTSCHTECRWNHGRCIDRISPEQVMFKVKEVLG
jgi:ADP-heptose:LPS heptosyltransferase